MSTDVFNMSLRTTYTVYSSRKTGTQAAKYFVLRLRWTGMKIYGLIYDRHYMSFVSILVLEELTQHQKGYTQMITAEESIRGIVPIY